MLVVPPGDLFLSSITVFLFRFSVGTNAYCPPEYIRSGMYDGKEGTVWQMGILLVEILCPESAFDKPEDALKTSPRIPEYLSSGTVYSLQALPLKMTRGRNIRVW